MADDAHQFQKSRERETRSVRRLLVYGVFCLFVAGCTAMGEQQPSPTSGMTIGLHAIPITEAIASGLKTKAPSGLYVMAVDARHPAARAGIKRGDVLLACGAKPLDDYEDLRTALNATEPGSEVMLTIWRDGIQRRLLVKPEVTKPARESLAPVPETSGSL